MNFRQRNGEINTIINRINGLLCIYNFQDKNFKQINDSNDSILTWIQLLEHIFENFQGITKIRSKNFE